MKPFITIFTLIVLLLVAYGAYILWQSTKVPQTVSLLTYAELKDLPPAVCHFSASDGRESVEGDLRAFNHLLRYDYTYTNAGRSLLVHMIVNDAGTAFAWNEGEKVGLKGVYERLALAANLLKVTSATCSTWWLPLFTDTLVAPQDVKFENFTG